MWMRTNGRLDGRGGDDVGETVEEGDGAGVERVFLSACSHSGDVRFLLEM